MWALYQKEGFAKCSAKDNRRPDPIVTLTMVYIHAEQSVKCIGTVKDLFNNNNSLSTIKSFTPRRLLFVEFLTPNK